MHKTETGTWMPAWVPESSFVLSFLLVLCSIVQSTTGGYDGSMLNGLNILPSYTDYFHLNSATTGLNTASVFIGGFLGPLISGIVADRLGRRYVFQYRNNFVTHTDLLTDQLSFGAP